MRNYYMVPALLGIAATFSSSAWAASAADLEQIPSSARCRAEAMNLKPLYGRRDEGMSREQALKLVDGTNGAPISRRAVQIAFDFPKLPRDGTTVYTLWSCHALEHYVAVRPLAEFSDEFAECYGKPAWQRETCANALWNKVHGFPGDRKSRAKSVTVVTPVAPVSRPGPASTPDAAR
jgi:hypothetical protein